MKLAYNTLPAPPKLVGGFSIEFFNEDGSLSIMQNKEFQELQQSFEAIARLFAAHNGMTYSVKAN